MGGIKPFDKEGWQPKTALGEKVKSGEITSIDQILDNGIAILEAEIVDVLLPNLQMDLLPIGQSKGKFGGGKRTIWRQVQKKTAEGNKPHFAALAVVGNKNGYIGIGYGKARETVPAREKAVRNAKLNVIKIRRGSGSWESVAPEANSIPFAVEGRCGSVRVKLMPAPKGTGLVIEKTGKVLMEFAGVKDIYSKTFGHTKTKLNAIKSFFEALKQLSEVKVQQKQYKDFGIVEGGQLHG
jgi:small subunit ribosomal protein S5